MEKPLNLTYAPTPPSDRAQVVHDADGFVLTLPPRLAWDFALSAVSGIGLAIILMVLPDWPPGRIHIVWRVIQSAIGTIVIYAVMDQFSRRREWTVISVCGDVMTVSKPHLLRSSSRTYWLGDYKDARTDCNEKIGSLALVCTDGTEKLFLENTLYRRADLRIAAGVLRDAIKRLDAKYARERVAIEVALGELGRGQSQG